MKSYKLNNIHADQNGYDKIIGLYNQVIKELCFEDYEVIFTEWLDANLCAPLGGIFDKIKSETFSDIKFTLEDKIRNILLRNQFLSYYGDDRQIDNQSTTIYYLKLLPEDGKYFNQYIATELINQHQLSDLSATSKRNIMRNIYEIFNNAKMHSNSDFIYTCGQFFPKKNLIKFTIADLGIGFKDNINKKFNINLTTEQAIRWAVKLNSTTKEVPGGIGLAYLKEFIISNNGTMHIVSGDGFYSCNNLKERFSTFTANFPGTIITMEFNIGN